MSNSGDVLKGATALKAVVVVSFLLVGGVSSGILWAVNTFASKAEFQQHVVTQLCSKAIGDYLRAKELAAVHPEDESRQIELDIALQMVNRVCPKAQGSKV